MHDHDPNSGHSHQHGDHHLQPNQSAAEFWDQCYAEAADVMWSGKPNGTVVAELADLPPGRALDVGCGEGADAMWLAERGWKVTAVDVSSVAIERARAAAETTGLGSAVSWQVVDVLTDRPEAEAYDLVLMMYPAFHHPVGPDTIRALTDVVAPGGTLLVVHHAVDPDPDPESDHGFDPADFVSVTEIADALAGTDFTVEVHETRSRPDPPPGGHHADDEVLRLTRST